MLLDEISPVEKQAAAGGRVEIAPRREGALGGLYGGLDVVGARFRDGRQELAVGGIDDVDKRPVPEGTHSPPISCTPLRRSDSSMAAGGVEVMVISLSSVLGQCSMLMTPRMFLPSNMSW